MPTATESCVLGRAKVADPVDLTVRREEIAVAIVFEGRHRICAAFASFSAADGEESHGAHWDPQAEESVDQGVEDGNIERNMECLDCFAGHSRLDIGFHGTR